MGVWIETGSLYLCKTDITVTPYVGVWIETFPEYIDAEMYKSLLMWECGLKLDVQWLVIYL